MICKFLLLLLSAQENRLSEVVLSRISLLEVVMTLVLRLLVYRELSDCSERPKIATQTQIDLDD